MGFPLAKSPASGLNGSDSVTINTKNRSLFIMAKALTKSQLTSTIAEKHGLTKSRLMKF